MKNHDQDQHVIEMLIRKLSGRELKVHLHHIMSEFKLENIPDEQNFRMTESQISK